MTGLVWLCKRETLRVSKLWTQTVLAPVVSSILFILVFGLSLGVTAALAIPAYAWAQHLFTTGKRLKS